MVISFLIYLATALTSTVAFYVFVRGKGKSLKIIGLLFAIGIPVFVAGVRYGIGTDYFRYIRGFERLSLGYVVRWEGLEFGFVGLNRLLILLGLNSQSIIFSSSLLMMGFLIKALENKKEVGLVSFGFLAFMLLFYQESFNLLRISLASCIFLYNIENIEKKKPVKYIIFTILASSFHISAIITLPIYWIFNFLNIQNRAYRGIYIAIGTALFMLFFSYILGRLIEVIDLDQLIYYEKYLTGEGSSIASAARAFLFNFPVAIPGILYYKQCRRQDKNFPIYFLLLVMGIIIKVLATSEVLYVHRFSSFFMISSVMVVPVYLKAINKKDFTILTLYILGYLLVYWLLVYFYFGNHGTVPYQWIF